MDGSRSDSVDWLVSVVVDTSHCVNMSISDSIGIKIGFTGRLRHVLCGVKLEVASNSCTN